VYEWGSSALNSLKFTGYERDGATGLDYANARMYNSARGRFMQSDPAGQRSANLELPESLNRYAYASNDPVNNIDPTGEGSEYWPRFLAQSACLSQGGIWRGPGFLPGGVSEVGFLCYLKTPSSIPTRGEQIDSGEWEAPNFVEARIGFWSAKDRSTGDKSDFYGGFMATIRYPDAGFCDKGSRRIIIIDFFFTDVAEIRNLPKNIADDTPGLSRVNTRGNLKLISAKLEVDYADRRGQVIVEVEFVVLLPKTNDARINVTLVGERRIKSPNVEPTLERKGIVNLACQ
jgi:RHS repeat-associated protein